MSKQRINTSPTSHEWLVLFSFTTHKSSDMSRLALENEAQSLPLLFVQFTTLQPFQHLLCQLLARRLAQPMIIILLYGNVLVHQANDGPINHRLTKLFY